MRGKRRKIFFDGLAVAHVAKDLIEDGQARSFCGRHKEPARRHQAKEPAHFERHRLAARVRAADEEEPVVLPHRDGDGHGALWIEQRMPPLDDMHGALPVEDGPHALQTVPVFGAGVEAVHFRKDVRIPLQRLAVRPDAVGKLG